MKRLFVILILAYLGMNLVHGILYMPMPFDESFYKMLVRSILRSGLPLRPAGELFTVNPPLALYLQAGAVKLFGDGIHAMRLWHCLLYVVPTVLLTVHMSRRLFGAAAGWAALLFYGTCAFFVVESIPAEVDLPFTFLSTLLLSLVLSRQEANSSANGGKLGYDVVVGFVWGLVLATKFFQGLVFAPILLCLLAFEAVGNLKQTFFSFLRIFLVALIGPIGWAAWSGAHDVSMTQSIEQMLRTIFTGGAAYIDAVSNKSPLSYALFVANFVGLPLFIAALAATVSNLTQWRRLLPPLLWIFWILVAMGVSKIRVVRYFDPALPALILLASGLCGERFAKLAGDMRGKGGWWLGILSVAVVALLQRYAVSHYQFAGYTVELFKAVLFGIAGSLLLLSLVPMVRQTVTSASMIFIFGASLLLSIEQMPLWSMPKSQWDEAVRERSLGRELETTLPKKSLLATPSMTTAYYADRDYVYLGESLSSAAVAEFDAKHPEYVVLDDGFLNRGGNSALLRSRLSAGYVTDRRLLGDFQLYRRR